MLKATAQTTARTAIQQRIVGAALETLKSNGFAGTSARSVASRGEFNQALIFYHFGSLHSLLLEALRESSESRLVAYRDAVADCESLEDLARVARDTYKEDVESGHVTVVSEMIAGSLTHPELRSPISGFMKPWLDFSESIVERFFGDSPFGELLPPRAVARAIVAFYMGMEQMSHLDGDEGAEPLFDAAGQLATLLGPMFKTS